MSIYWGNRLQFIRSTEQEPSVDGVKKKTVHYGLSPKKEQPNMPNLESTHSRSSNFAFEFFAKKGKKINNMFLIYFEINSFIVNSRKFLIFLSFFPRSSSEEKILSCYQHWSLVKNVRDIFILLLLWLWVNMFISFSVFVLCNCDTPMAPM